VICLLVAEEVAHDVRADHLIHVEFQEQSPSGCPIYHCRGVARTVALVAHRAGRRCVGGGAERDHVQVERTPQPRQGRHDLVGGEVATKVAPARFGVRELEHAEERAGPRLLIEPDRAALV
jgi:hypothetical protein